jgi:hypothetical protein
MGRLLGLRFGNSLRGAQDGPPSMETTRHGPPQATRRSAALIQLAKDTAAGDAPVRINDDWIRDA